MQFTLDLPDRYADRLISAAIREMLDRDPGPSTPRTTKGKRTKSKRRKLNWQQVQAIRRAFTIDHTPAKWLASHYGISASHVYAIARGATWDAPPPDGTGTSDLGTLRRTK